MPGDVAQSQDVPGGFVEDNGQSNPYLAAIGALSPSEAEMTEQEIGQDNHYLDALGISGSASSEDISLDPATLESSDEALIANSDFPSDQTDADLPVDDPAVPLPEDDDPSINSG